MYNLLVAVPLHIVCQLISPVEGTTEEHNTALLPRGYIAYPEIGVGYKFYSNEITWDQAREVCIADGASLAIIDSITKTDYAVGLKIKNLGVWTGGHRLFNNNVWTNVKTGKRLGFLPWIPGTQNPYAGTAKCLAVWGNGSGVGAWECENLLPALCEIQIS